jgi:hypothetical protein
MTVVVEIAGPDYLPTRPRIEAQCPAADHVGSIHLPDRDLAAARVLQQDVGITGATEVASPYGLPARPGLGLTDPPPMSLFPSISQIETWPLVLCHRMSE